MMPIYVFQSESGETVEKHFPMSEAPKIGDEVEIDGQAFRRVFSAHIDAAGIERKTHGYPFASNSLPSGIPGCEHDSKNRPIIRSQKHERDVLAQTGWVRE